MKVKVYLLFFYLLLLTNIIKRDSYESSRTSMEGCYGLTYPYPKECKVILTMIDDREGNVVILAKLEGICFKWKLFKSLLYVSIRFVHWIEEAL